MEEAFETPFLISAPRFDVVDVLAQPKLICNILFSNMLQLVLFSLANIWIDAQAKPNSGAHARGQLNSLYPTVNIRKKNTINTKPVDIRYYRM